jgi:membrane-associated phospholipid phosphatase
LSLVAACVLPWSDLRAQADTARPPAVVTAGDVARAGLFTGLALLAYPVDDDVRTSVRGEGPQRSRTLDAMAEFGYAYGQPGVLGLGVALWGGGLVAHNTTVAATGLRALEAIAVSGTITSVLKGVIGRARPRVSPDDKGDFEWGRGFGASLDSDGSYSSLPSGHATVAFAFASAVTSEVAFRAPEHARTVAIVTYGAATVTAWSRMHMDAHWLSDVTLGAGIGMVSGWAVTRWHRTRPGNRVDRWLLRPVMEPGIDGGARMGVCLCPR